MGRCVRVFGTLCAPGTTPHAAEVPLQRCRHHTCLHPKPNGWAHCRRSVGEPAAYEPVRCVWRAPVVFTASLVVSALAPTRPAPAPSPAAPAVRLTWEGTTAAQARRRRARYRRAPSRHRCLRHSGSSRRAIAADAAAAAHSGGRRAGAGLDWTKGPRVASPDRSRPRRRLTCRALY
jgi:hypothetical protein